MRHTCELCDLCAAESIAAIATHRYTAAQEGGTIRRCVCCELCAARVVKLAEAHDEISPPVEDPTLNELP